MWRRSATLRLTLTIAAVILAVGLAALSIQFWLVRGALERQQVALLQADLDGLAALYDQRRIIALRQAMEYRSLAQTNEGEIYLLQDRNGTTLAGNLDHWPQAIAISAAETAQGFDAATPVELSIDGTPYLVDARMLRGGFPMLVGRSLVAPNRTLAALRSVILAVAAGTLLVALVAGAFAARSVLARIRQLNRLADNIASDGAALAAAGEHARDEFHLLERHIHAMLDRIAALERATRQLSDTIAHELRTPLNRISAKLSRLPESEDLSAARDELKSTVRIFDALLDIAGNEAGKGSGPDLAPLDLSDVCQDVFDLYEPLAEERNLDFTAEITPDARILGDRNLVSQLLSNLIDNALKFARPGDAVHLLLTTLGNRHITRISDTGPGAPPDLGAAAFDRFTRGARDRNRPGHGLGLTLVQAIATRHGAKTEILTPDSGFAIEVRWPKL